MDDEQLYIALTRDYEKRLAQLSSKSNGYCLAASFFRALRAAQAIIHGQQDTLDTADVDAATHNRMVTDRMPKRQE